MAEATKLLRRNIDELQVMPREQIEELYEISGKVVTAIHVKEAELTETDAALIEPYDTTAVNGVYYGYPSCCILSFAVGRTLVDASQEYDGISSDNFLEHFGTEWVPCRRCSDRLIESGDMRARIAKYVSRVAHLPSSEANEILHLLGFSAWPALLGQRPPWWP